MVFKVRKCKKKDLNQINIVLNCVTLVQCGSNYQTKAIKFLGIMIDCNLDWGEHINYVGNKLRKIIFSLNRSKRCGSSGNALTTALIHVGYAGACTDHDPIWGLCPSTFISMHVVPVR